ncbi:maltose ABC transporter substrate-binding protein [Clostridium thermarum]|uniref:sugar ABC transporter substrate-binding protein n=1 Tax=Clostridium thermarum TaxID=1716543 RepID=UPI0013D6BCF0|nr:maltose ABC transporter substrate-binding protein [Clostridium thermarum]
MKKNKVLVALALTLSIGATVLSGCAPEKKAPEPVETQTPAEQGENSQSTGLQPEEGASLKLWCDNDTYNEKIVELFNAKYPDIELVVENVSTTDARGKLELSGPTGQGADVLVMAHDGVAISAQSGNILELSELESDVKNRALENAVEAASYNGKLYAQPISIKTIGLFYNKKLVDKPAATWEEMLEFAKTYNDPSKNKFTMFWQVNDPYHAHFALSVNGYEMFGPNHNDKTKINWDTTEALKGMEFYKELKSLYPIKSDDATWDAMTTNFGEGKAPYALTGPWSIKGYKEKGVDFGIVALPTYQGNHPITLSTVDVAVVSSYTKYPNAAKLLAQFLGSEEGLKLYYDTKGELPATKDATNYDYIKADVHLSGIAQQSQYSMPMPYIPEMANVWDPYKKALTAVYDGILDPATALKNAQDEYNTAITAK